MFTINKAAQIADLKPVTLHGWFKRGLVELAPSDRPAPKGGTRYLSAPTTLAICIAARLTRLGSPVELSVLAGMKFAHTANGSPPRSSGGALYSNAPTMIAVADGEVRIFPAETPKGILAHIEDGAVVVPIDPIVRKFGLRVTRAEMQRRITTTAPRP